MTAVTFPNGNGYSDDGTAANDMRNGGFRTNLLPMIGDTIAVANNAVTAAAAAVPAATTATTAATTATQQAAIAVAAANTAVGTSLIKQPSEIAGIDPVIDFQFSASTAVPSGVITGSSSKWVTGPNGLLTSVAAGTCPVDFDPTTGVTRGLLVEESRTNQIRNPRGEGAIAGTPGAWPTNWAGPGASNGISISVIGSGTQSGVPYLEFRLFGTATAATLIQPTFEGSGVVSASAGQTWTSSFYLALAAGSATGITVTSRIREGDASSVYLTDDLGSAISPSGSLARYTHTVALTNASVGKIASGVRFVVASGVAIDATYRVGLPQLELGASATSPVLPPVGSPAATTRAADVNTLLLSGVSGWNAAEGTIYIEARTAKSAPAGSQTIAHFDDGTFNNRLAIYRDASSEIRCVVSSGGTAVAFLSPGPVGNDTDLKVAFAWKSGSFAASLNGGTAVTSATGAVPAGLTTKRIGHDVTGSHWNSAIKRDIAFPRRLSDATLKLLTA